MIFCIFARLKITKMKRFLYILLTALIALGCSSEPQPKYVFYFIGDGMGINQVRGTELYNSATGNGPEVVNFSHFPVISYVTTHSADALVTDSAAAGSALSTGVKTYNYGMGVDAEGNPVEHLGEWAKAAGAGVGVITSVGVNHATPAAFYAHTKTRSNYEEISRQLISSSVDFTAGAAFLMDKKTELTPAYYEQMARDSSITIFKGPDFTGADLVPGRVICLSGKEEEELPYAIDRKEDDTQLKDFVKAGIAYLESHFEKEGFFVMIEGGKIDYSGHSNDAVTTFMETNDMAYSVDLALEFMERHPDQTLIVVTADHETGGLVLGAGNYSMHPERLAWQKSSILALTAMFRDEFFPEDKPYKTPSWEKVKDFFEDNLGLWENVEVSQEEEEKLKDLYRQTFGKGGNKDLITKDLYSVNYKIVWEAVRCLDLAADFQYGHGAHSGCPVGVYAIGIGAEAFGCLHDNTEIPITIAKVAGYKK